MVAAYWKIGRDIVEEEQQGSARAGYGSFVIKELSAALTKQYGRGFGLSTIHDIRQFYLAYKDRTILHALRGESAIAHEQKGLQPIFDQRTTDNNSSFKLGWIHYRALMRISKKEARQFYEIEAIKNNWSGRELERQIGSLLFDRLSKSKDKDGLLKLASCGEEIISPIDAIRDPMILEFLNLPESHVLSESKLEEALISNLQHFLLELGKGFAFIARQKRITLDGSHYYADLVFYHTILKCYVILELKTKALSHGDLGQIQFYVNYFDQEVKLPDDNPTIGLIMCTEKSDAMVRYTLGTNAKQIFASKYQLHLPSIEELEQELQKEIKEIRYRMRSTEVGDLPESLLKQNQE
jgi:predicted nuclease of restriction endonuclease-like (RecB) superfamily